MATPKGTRLAQAMYFLVKPSVFKDTKLGARMGAGLAGVSAGITIQIARKDLEAVANQAKIIAAVATEKKFDMIKAIFKKAYCSIENLKTKLSEVAPTLNSCLKKETDKIMQGLEIRMNLGASLPSMTPYFEVEFPLLEEIAGRSNPLCKLKPCFQNFFSKLGSFIGASNIPVPDICDDSAGSLIELARNKVSQRTRLRNALATTAPKTSVKFGIGAKLPPAVTASAQCKTDAPNPFTECSGKIFNIIKAMKDRLVSKGKTFQGTMGTDLKTQREQNRPLTGPDPSSAAAVYTEGTNCEKTIVFGLAIGNEVAARMGVMWGPIGDCFKALCLAVKHQLSIPDSVTKCEGGTGAIMGSGNPFIAAPANAGAITCS